MSRLALVLIIALSFAGIASAQIKPQIETKKPPKFSKTWLALSISSMAAIETDTALTIKDQDRYGGLLVEQDPFARPFFDLPHPAFVASSVAWSAGVDYAALRMEHSRRWYRKVWWVPQVAMICGNLYGISGYSQLPWNKSSVRFRR